MEERKMRRAALVALTFAVGATIPFAAADEVTLAPSKDNTLYESSTGALSNGSGAHFFAGVTAFLELRRGLMAFDVSAIPSGSTIDSVELTLHMSMTIAEPVPVTLHRTLADWGEGGSVAPGQQGAGGPAAPGDATWLHTFHDTQFWANPGGDFAAMVSSAQTVADDGFYTWPSTPELVADVQSWVDGPAGNFGWTLVGDESSGGTAKRFDTRDHVNPALRPSLRVQFTPVPEPSSLVLLSALALSMLRRRHA
jgi:hypothetical protein